MTRDLIGNIIICIGVLFVIFGIIGIYRFRNFYSRVLIASKIDTVGFITVCAGVIVRGGFTWFSLKVLLLVAVVLIINPVVTHAITRSAHYGGLRMQEEERDASGS
ncbi:MAG: monovalent cation/H(+) antiporter subunit G [Clostridia bacterium]|nr:monovalent cation/H(+) antiporter subunit G [Clostridia bacterium]